jgi:hypothetical protein
MNSKTGRFIAIVGISLGLMTPPNRALADSASVKQLSAEWWQWALSIPTSENPQMDDTGEDCMVGQRGEVWFLAGVSGSGIATRTCSVPADKSLFFPVANSVFFDSPNVCQGPESIPIEEMRAAVAAFIDDVTNIVVEVDGKAISSVHRVGRSFVYAVALPEENVFDAPCAPEGVPAGIYSPTVDDGLYVRLNPLEVGNHTLHFQAEGPGGFFQDVTYHLTVVPVIQK